MICSRHNFQLLFITIYSFAIENKITDCHTIQANRGIQITKSGREKKASKIHKSINIECI